MGILKLLFKLLFFILIGLGIFWAYTTYILHQPIQFDKFDFVALSNIDMASLSKTAGDQAQQAKLMSENVWKDVSEKSKVLGENIKADDTKSTAEKSFEYARYLYCQQVVSEWEKEGKVSPGPSSNSSPSPVTLHPSSSPFSKQSFSP